MSESGLWRKGVSFAVIASMVLMLSIAAVTLTPTAPTADAVVVKYIYEPVEYPSGGSSNRLDLPIGQSHEFDITFGIDWATNDKRSVDTTLNCSCASDGIDETASMFFDFQPSSTFTLDAGNNWEHTVTTNVTSVGGATTTRIDCIVKAWEVTVGNPPVGQGTGTHVYILTEVGPPIYGGGEPGGCFIATAAYGTASAAEIDVLRAFRDEVMLESTVGSQLVDLYYQASPPVADFISENDVLRTLVRELVVDPIASLVEVTGSLWRH